MKNRNLPVNDSWATPEWFYEKLNQEYKFDFDPCPYNENEISDQDNGLSKDWGQRNFVNPPYSRKLKEAFILKALEESKKGKLVVMLLPVSTSTKIFHEVIQPNAKKIEFVRGRLKFGKYDEMGKYYELGTGMHDSMIVVFDGTGE